MRPGVRGRRPGVENPVTPDGPDDSTAVMWWKGLGEVAELVFRHAQVSPDYLVGLVYLSGNGSAVA